MDSSTEYEKKFLAIKQRFIYNLSDLIMELKDFKDCLDNDEVSNLENVYMHIHKLSGSSATFGFAELGKMSQNIEQKINLLKSDVKNEKYYQEVSKDLDSFIKNIKQILSTNDQLKQHNISQDIIETEDNANHILIAEDDRIIQEVMKATLAKTNCKTTILSNGVEVIDYIEEEVGMPDLIILDLNMPKMGGFEVLKKLKLNPRTQNIPIIILTGDREDENLIKGISSGATDYITKPFNPDDLLYRVTKILKLHNTKILIADDDEIICEILNQRFHRMGYSVIFASSGNEALIKMQSEKPNIAIIDIMMPGIDGLAVLRQSKNHVNTAKIPIVLLTAKGQQENVLKGLEMGAHDYITKPFDIDELAIRVAGILQRETT